MGKSWDSKIGELGSWKNEQLEKCTIGNGGFGELEMWGIPKLGTLGIWNLKQTLNVGN